MPTTTTHTPGPWTVEVQTAVLNDCRVGLRIVAPDRLWGVASVVEMPGERRDADAHLIAAAPKMLAALEATVERMDGLAAVITRLDRACGSAAGQWLADNSRGVLARKLHHDADEARAAIRAARGEG